ncbi:MAG TPA: heparan-alpha-glucosaminide N-acetyltransferase domain-containing protein, partial [Planctomycetota bacterium]|nr:heparan-alpha-glucosaminide N-acetyltransferase domain-containing protein [Planctomycetota bacterium]
MPSQDPPSASSRIESIDWLRGLVMILMLLDHARDFIHQGGFDHDPLDAATTTPALYLTRWVTHLCAPTFVFLAGVSARLQLRRGLAPQALSRFLLTRGLFLVGLELFILHPLMFGLDFEPLAFLQVIWALGWSMVVLAGLVFAPLWLVALFGAALVLLHNLFDGIQV